MYSVFSGAEILGAKLELYNELKCSKLKRLLSFSWLPFFKLPIDINLIIKNNTKIKFKSIHVFNDTPIVVQYIMSKLHADEVKYIEVGTAPYNSHYIYNNMCQRLVKKFLFGNYYDWKPILGTSKYIKSGIFTHKSFVRKENMIYPASEFIYKSDYSTVISQLASKLNFEKKNNLKQKGIVFLMPKIAPEGDELLIELKKTMFAFVEANWNVFVKYHPLNKGGELIDIIGIQEIESSIPAEVIPSIIDNIKIVVGMETTCLPSLVFLYPAIREKVFSIVDIIHGDINVQRYFENIGINLITTPLNLIRKMDFETELIAND